jgi:hypothetical protein
MNRHRLFGLLRFVALGLVLAALLAPAAQAAYETDGGALATNTRAPSGTRVSDDGFNWGGATAGIAVAIALGAGGVVMVRRRRGRLIGA